jgi:hypothetical protein
MRAVVARVRNGTWNVSPMGGAVPSKIPDHETNSSEQKPFQHEVEVDSKIQSDDLQKLALGDISQSNWSEHKQREYSEFKKTKSNTVDWSESNLSASAEQKSSSPIKSVKHKPAPPTKPRPPANRPPSISNQPKIPSKGSLQADWDTSSPLIRESQPKISPQKYLEAKQNDDATTTSMNSDQSSKTGSRIISKVQRCVDESDSDDNEEASYVYDWTLTQTQGPSTHPELKFSQTTSTRTESILRDAATPKHFVRSVSDKDDELIADFRNTDTPPVESHAKPNNIPILILPSDGSFHSSQEFKQMPMNQPRITMTLPPRVHQKSGPMMTGGPRGPIPVRGPPSIRTNGPSAASQRSTMSPSPNHYIMSQLNRPPQEHHQVKETNDVKRNRAQIPSTLTHAKPTTGDWLKKRYIVNNFILLDLLGTGSYGEVKLCKDRTTDKLYAMKIFSKEMLKKRKGGNTSETYFEDIKREIAIMKKLSHPNVLKLFEVLDDPNVRQSALCSSLIVFIGQ